MRFKLLGNSGLRVSEISLGAMTFGEEWGFGSSKEESRRVFDAYVEMGGNFIDTANRYTEGTSEKYVGEFVGRERERFVIATKYTLDMRKGDPNASGNHRKNLVQALNASLRRLNTDYIDLYWVHAWDFITPVEEIMRALDDQVRLGKVLYVGVSDAPAWCVSQANTIASLRGWTPFAALQIEYSLVERTPERDLIPMAEALNLAVTPWSPLGGGVLSGKYSKDGGPPDARFTKMGKSGKLTERNLAIAAEVGRIAREIGGTSSQVALNWLRQRPTGCIPVVGARTAAQIRENCDCVKVPLSLDHLKRLDEASKIDLGFPHDFLASENIRNIVYGGTWDRIEKRRG
ncbi:MAG: aldo/keto reductase [Planctomycetes bacterium]|nr:aldo/keto reductase [Planctomycetota bacterium]